MHYHRYRVCFFPITHLSVVSYLARCFLNHTSLKKWSIMCLSFKRILIIGTQKGEKRLKMNKKIYYCWLSIERRLYLVCQAKRQRHHLLYVGVVMSSCSPLVMLLMGINAIIWLLIQISLRIQSEQTHRRSMGVSAVTGSTLSSFCKCLAQQKKHTHKHNSIIRGWRGFNNLSRKRVKTRLHQCGCADEPQKYVMCREKMKTRVLYSRCRAKPRSS